MAAASSAVVSRIRIESWKLSPVKSVNLSPLSGNRQKLAIISPNAQYGVARAARPWLPYSATPSDKCGDRLNTSRITATTGGPPVPHHTPHSEFHANRIFDVLAVSRAGVGGR